KYFKPLAYMFSICVAIGALGAGNMVQSNTMAHSLVDALEISSDNEVMFRWILGFVISGLVATVILGGIKRIGQVASYLVPFMSIVYVVSAIVVIFINSDQIFPAFDLIFYHAFNPISVVGGSASGVGIWMTISWGLRRGLFSNEAGQGSAAMAHSTAKVEEPVREGLVAMLGPFIDTIVICTMTALVIITTGVWANGENGAVLTMTAFNTALPGYGQWMVVVGVMLFAFSTVIAWSYYGEKGVEYLGGDKVKIPYKWLYVIFTLLGASLDLEPVWNFADTANGLMSAPNLIALIALSGTVVKITKKYMKEKREGKHVPFDQMKKIG
ncbi:MAG: alanine:cation symporter family protein, partial [Calditrichaeota bacterium]